MTAFKSPWVERAEAAELPYRIEGGAPLDDRCTVCGLPMPTDPFGWDLVCSPCQRNPMPSAPEIYPLPDWGSRV